MNTTAVVYEDAMLLCTLVEALRMVQEISMSADATYIIGANTLHWTWVTALYRTLHLLSSETP